MNKFLKFLLVLILIFAVVCLVLVNEKLLTDNNPGETDPSNMPSVTPSIGPEITPSISPSNNPDSSPESSAGNDKVVSLDNYYLIF